MLVQHHTTSRQWTKSRQSSTIVDWSALSVSSNSWASSKNSCMYSRTFSILHITQHTAASHTSPLVNDAVWHSTVTHNTLWSIQKHTCNFFVVTQAKLTDYQNSFTVRFLRKYCMHQSQIFPLDLKRVYYTPCETWVLKIIIELSL